MNSSQNAAAKRPVSALKRTPLVNEAGDENTVQNSHSSNAVSDQQHPVSESLRATPASTARVTIITPREEKRLGDEQEQESKRREITNTVAAAIDAVVIGATPSKRPAQQQSSAVNMNAASADGSGAAVDSSTAVDPDLSLIPTTTEEDRERSVVSNDNDVAVASSPPHPPSWTAANVCSPSAAAIVKPPTSLPPKTPSRPTSASLSRGVHVGGGGPSTPHSNNQSSAPPHPRPSSAATERDSKEEEAAVGATPRTPLASYSSSLPSPAAAANPHAPQMVGHTPYKVQIKELVLTPLHLQSRPQLGSAASHGNGQHANNHPATHTTVTRGAGFVYVAPNSSALTTSTVALPYDLTALSATQHTSSSPSAKAAKSGGEEYPVFTPSPGGGGFYASRLELKMRISREAMNLNYKKRMSELDGVPVEGDDSSTANSPKNRSKALNSKVKDLQHDILKMQGIKVPTKAPEMGTDRVFLSPKGYGMSDDEMAALRTTVNEIGARYPVGYGEAGNRSNHSSRPSSAAAAHTPKAVKGEGIPIATTTPLYKTYISTNSVMNTTASAPSSRPQSAAALRIVRLDAYDIVGPAAAPITTGGVPCGLVASITNASGLSAKGAVPLVRPPHATTTTTTAMHSSSMMDDSTIQQHHNGGEPCDANASYSSSTAAVAAPLVRSTSPLRRPQASYVAGAMGLGVGMNVEAPIVTSRPTSAYARAVAADDQSHHSHDAAPPSASAVISVVLDGDAEKEKSKKKNHHAGAASIISDTYKSPRKASNMGHDDADEEEFAAPPQQREAKGVDLSTAYYDVNTTSTVGRPGSALASSKRLNGVAPAAVPPPPTALPAFDPRRDVVNMVRSIVTEKNAKGRSQSPTRSSSRGGDAEEEEIAKQQEANSPWKAVPHVPASTLELLGITRTEEGHKDTSRAAPTVEVDESNVYLPTMPPFELLKQNRRVKAPTGDGIYTLLEAGMAMRDAQLAAGTVTAETSNLHAPFLTNLIALATAMKPTEDNFGLVDALNRRHKARVAELRAQTPTATTVMRTTPVRKGEAGADDDDDFEIYEDAAVDEFGNFLDDHDDPDVDGNKSIPYSIRDPQSYPHPRRAPSPPRTLSANGSRFSDGSSSIIVGTNAQHFKEVGRDTQQQQQQRGTGSITYSYRGGRDSANRFTDGGGLPTNSFLSTVRTNTTTTASGVNRTRPTTAGPKRPASSAFGFAHSALSAARPMSAQVSKKEAFIRLDSTPAPQNQPSSAVSNLSSAQSITNKFNLSSNAFEVVGFNKKSSRPSSAKPTINNGSASHSNTSANGSAFMQQRQQGDQPKTLEESMSKLESTMWRRQKARLDAEAAAANAAVGGGHDSITQQQQQRSTETKTHSSAAVSDAIAEGDHRADKSRDTLSAANEAITAVTSEPIKLGKSRIDAGDADATPARDDVPIASSHPVATHPSSSSSPHVISFRGSISSGMMLGGPTVATTTFGAPTIRDTSAAPYNGCSGKRPLSAHQQQQQRPSSAIARTSSATASRAHQRPASAMSRSSSNYEAHPASPLAIEGSHAAAPNQAVFRGAQYGGSVVVKGNGGVIVSGSPSVAPARNEVRMGAGFVLYGNKTT